MRTRVQHARVGAAFIKAIARMMSACMPPNYLAALGPGGEQPPSQDTQNQPEKERCFGENSPSALIESHSHFVTMRGTDPRYLSSPSTAGVMQVDQDQLTAGDFD
jgi:hypothetical protein